METKRVCAEIDLDAVKKNISIMKSRLSGDTRLYMVVKADGYGHGAVQIARAIENDDRILGFAVATITEGIELRDAGIKKDILILGITFPEVHESVVAHGLIPTISSIEQARSFDDIGRISGRKVKVHIKLDTGMGRIGFMPDEAGINEVIEICRMDSLTVEGIFTHFARADENDKTATDIQYEKYKKVIDVLSKNGIEIPVRHAANSAAILSYPMDIVNAARAGVAIYGLMPSDEVGPDRGLIPALSLYSHIVHIKTVSKGTPISYGGTHVTEKEMKVATVPIGYADGYPRSLSDKGEVLIRGKRARILGRVCMDQMMVDVSDIKDVDFGDKVTLIGKDAGDCITAEELGDKSGRFNYELVCDLNKRIPRIYKGGDSPL